MIKNFAVITLMGLLVSSSLIYAQERLPRNDSDADGIVDTADIDDDNDGVPDIWELAADGGDIDSDKDGMPDRLDLDSDNDSLLDWQESGATRVADFSSLSVVAGRLRGDVGENGMLNIFERDQDSHELIYRLLDTDADGVADLNDLDSDNDGLPDMREAGVIAIMDNDRDARIDAPPGSVGRDGIADQIQNINDQSCCDLNADGADDATPRNTDAVDFPDFQDLDSDNDGVSDILEAGGSDINGDGMIDSFNDAVGDGMDDSLFVLPLAVIDSNANGASAEVDNSEQPTTSSEPLSEPLSDGSESGRDPVARPGYDRLPLNDAALSDPASGVVQTGLSASGCSIASRSFDILLMLLVVGSVAVMGWRFTLRRLR